MKRWMLGIGYLVFAAVVSAEEKSDFHAFTAKDGRAIEAKIVKYDTLTGKTTFQLRNGRKSTVVLSIFCEADQIIIKDWYLSRELFSSSKLVVKIDKKTITADRYHEKRGDWQSHFPGMDFEDVAFDVKIDNRSNVDLKALTVDYCIFYISKRKEFSGKSELQQLSSGNGSGWFSTEKKDLGTREIPLKRRGDFAIETLLSKKSVQQLTKEVQIREGAESSYGDTRGKVRTYKIREVEDKIKGIIIRVSIPLSSGGFARKEYSYPTKFLDKETVDWSRREPTENTMVSSQDSGGNGLHDYTEGMNYRSGKNGRAKDIQKAIQCFERSGANGTPKSYFWIGDIYERGGDVPKDWVKAAAYYKKSFDAGWSSGASQLGDLYMKGGNGLQRDEALALEWLEKGAATEDKNCLRDLAWYYGANRSAEKRDGKKAAGYADRMMDQGVTYFLYTGTAAAAYAEDGQFDKAIIIQKEVVAFINKTYPEEKNANYRAEFQRNLERFQRGEALPTKP